MGFTKLDEGILLSSIMQEPSDVFKVWIALLAACKEDGIARVSSVGIAGVCFLPIDTTKAAFKRLESPDEDSRTITDDGRRIRRVDGGYEIINYFKYREFTYREKEAQRKYEKYHSPELSGEIRKLPEDSASASASASASVLSVDVKKEVMQGDKKDVVPVPDHLSGVWSDFMDVRKAKKAVNSPRALNSILNELNRLSSNQDEQVKIIEQSIRSSWKDVYQLKGENNGRNRKRSAGNGGYDAAGNAVGAVAKSGEFSEGVVTLDGVGSVGKT